MEPNKWDGWSRASLETELANRIYAAAEMIEELERAGRVFGNGHQARQKIAAYAENELKERWKNEE